MAKKTNSHGGRREGAGRPKGTGSGPSDDARIHRVAVMLDRHDLRRIKKVAKMRKVPIGTAAFQIVSKSVRAAVK